MVHPSIARPLARFLTGAAGAALMLPGSPAATQLQPVLMHPAISIVSDYVQLTTSTTPPTEAQCFAATPIARRCFTPQAIRAAYNLQPLYDAGLDGRGMTIAIVDSYGSDTIAHDLH